MMPSNRDMDAMGWHFEIDVATKSDMETFRSELGNRLGIKLSHCNEHHVADEIWLLSQEEAMDLATTIIETVAKAANMEKKAMGRLDQISE